MVNGKISSFFTFVLQLAPNSDVKKSPFLRLNVNLTHCLTTIEVYDIPWSQRYLPDLYVQRYMAEVKVAPKPEVFVSLSV